MKLKRKPTEYAIEFVVAIACALVIAILIRQMWFEHYEIPSGSMRPTFQEQDLLIVSKTTFGINTPLSTSHLLFEPDLVQRAGVVIWSGDHVDLPDTDTTFFGFPMKKRYIKRMIGKPGDSLYFYGGKIYGVDSEGNDITELRTSPWLANLDHIPFLSFEGRISVQGNRTAPPVIYLKHMNQPIGKLVQGSRGDLQGDIAKGDTWVKDEPNEKATVATGPLSYSDFFGIRNFAMARLLTRDQVKLFFGPDMATEEASIYLELHHNPNLSNPKPVLVPSGRGHINLLLEPFITVIPLQQKHLDALAKAMSTSRFVVKNGRGIHYRMSGSVSSSRDPAFPDIPDGTYEFSHGTVSKIGWGGVPSTVSTNSPLYSHDPLFIQKLFNLGIEMSVDYEPQGAYQTTMPSRYAYFRDGALYVMGEEIFSKDDPTLKDFVENEAKREKQADAQHPYVAFKDYGPPVDKDGNIDVEFIRTFGFTVPPKHYFVLGDNYAVSADSRVFGTVPEENLQGAPSLIIWPPGPRWGIPQQPPYPWITLPNMIIWGTVVVILLIWFGWHRRKN